MAALSRILKLKPSLFPPSLFVSSRNMVSTIFVGGLSFSTTENGLCEAFSKHGRVVDADVITDRLSGRSKGYGFVSFASEDEAKNAAAEMNKKELNGRVIFVDIAKPRSNFGEGIIIARGPPGYVKKMPVEPKKKKKKKTETTTTSANKKEKTEPTATSVKKKKKPEPTTTSAKKRE